MILRKVKSKQINNTAVCCGSALMEFTTVKMMHSWFTTSLRDIQTKYYFFLKFIVQIKIFLKQFDTISSHLYKA